MAVVARKTVLVSGATGSGKTNFAKARIARIPPADRLLTIEDTRKLVVDHRNVVHIVYSSARQGHAAASEGGDYRRHRHGGPCLLVR